MSIDLSFITSTKLVSAIRESVQCNRIVEVSELSDEAIRLTRMLHRVAPDEPEVGGLLALMLLTDARRAARLDARPPVQRRRPRPMGVGGGRGR